MPQAMRLLSKEGGMVAYYRGVGPAMFGVAPYMALELASFDFLKKVLATEDLKSSPAMSFVSEGAQGLYRGFVPSCLKNLPNKGIRLATFDTAKTVMAMAEAQEEEE